MTASCDYHIGVDYHKSYSHLVVQDSSGKTLRSGRVKNDCSDPQNWTVHNWSFPL